MKFGQSEKEIPVSYLFYYFYILLSIAYACDTFYPFIQQKEERKNNENDFSK